MPGPQVKVPLITPARCQLHSHHTTITRAHKLRLRQSFTHNTSTTHLRTRLQLSRETYDDIAWLEFHRAFQSLTMAQQRTARRLIYGFLPTQRRLFRNNTTPSPYCPHCHVEEETDLHFLKCGGASTWSDNLFKPLEALFHKYKATHWIQQSIRGNLQRFLDGNNPRIYDPWIQTPTTSQTNISWHFCFLGMFSKTWIHKQDRTTTHKTGSRLITKIARLLLTATIDRWNQRCNALHKTTNNSNETQNRLHTKITALYMLKDRVLPGDRRIFHMDLPNLLLKSNKYLEMFILHNTPIIKASISQQKRNTQRQHRDIATYFPPKVQDTSPAGAGHF